MHLKRCRVRTSQCSRVCWSHSWCRWILQDSCRCSCWRSRCSSLRFGRGRSHTRLCPLHSARHGNQPNTHTQSRSHGPDTHRRYCTDLREKNYHHCHIQSLLLIILVCCHIIFSSLLIICVTYFILNIKLPYLFIYFFFTLI